MLKYEVPKASICFENHIINLKFVVADILVDYILGNIFLATIELHRLTRLKDNKAGYFIYVPNSKGTTKRIEFPYISNPRVSTMVQTVQNLDKVEARLADLKDLKCTLRVEEQLKDPQVKRKIEDLQKQIEEECCSKEPNVFWDRKQHIVELPYKEGYTGKPCKSRAIPMSKDYKNLCEK